MNAFEKILSYLKTENKWLCRVLGIGKHHAKKGPRTILIKLESPVSKDLVLNFS